MRLDRHKYFKMTPSPYFYALNLRFHDGISGKGWRYEDDAGESASDTNGLAHRIEDRQAEMRGAALKQSCAAGIDLAVRYGSGRWPGVEAIHLLGNEVFPVCAPSYLRAASLFASRVNRSTKFCCISWNTIATGCLAGLAA
jgi:hypothetical protein